MPNIAATEGPRDRARRAWRNEPQVVLYMAEGNPVNHEAFMVDGSILDGMRMVARQAIEMDRIDSPTAPARAWEATHVQNGQHRWREMFNEYLYRVRTARHGSGSVVGKRIVQFYRNGEWKSFGFITRDGGFRLWVSNRHESGDAYVRNAARLFNGAPREAYIRTCWLCNEETAAGFFDEGLCSHHLNRLPVNAALVLADTDDDYDDDGYEEEDGDYNGTTPSWAQTSRPSRSRRQSVEVQMSEINVEFIR